MENENSKDLSFDFLKQEIVQKYFAELNFTLLSGKHFLREDNSTLWDILDDYYPELSYYYDTLYQLHLTYDTKEGQKYFFLTFYENSKGKFAATNLYKEFTPKNIFFGILLLNLFFDKQFEKKKPFSWEEIWEKIIKSEWHSSFTIFFSKYKGTTQYKEKIFKADFKAVIDEFEKLAWTKWLHKKEENFEFEIKVSIYRFIDLYKDEIQNIEQTIQNHARNT